MARRMQPASYDFHIVTAKNCPVQAQRLVPIAMIAVFCKKGTFFLQLSCPCRQEERILHASAFAYIRVPCKCSGLFFHGNCLTYVHRLHDRCTSANFIALFRKCVCVFACVCVCACMFANKRTCAYMQACTCMLMHAYVHLLASASGQEQALRSCKTVHASILHSLGSMECGTCF
eukprot:216489-Pelagomonas_calceolata.AAC.8